jgi:hypothetical protein
MASDMNDVRGLIQELVDGKCRGFILPPVLKHWAQAASRGTGIGRAYEADDVLAELLRRLAAGEARQLGYVAMPDTQLRMVLRRRLRQTAVELSDGWDLYKALRAHVGNVLEGVLPAAPAQRPASLLRGEQYAKALVAEAVAWLGREEPEYCTAAAIAGRLAALYVPRLVPIAPANDDVEVGIRTWAAANDDVDEALEALDGDVLERRLAALLTRSEARVLHRRLEGDALRVVAEGEGCAIATVFARERSAIRKVSQFVRHAGVSPTGLRRLLARAAA